MPFFFYLKKEKFALLSVMEKQLNFLYKHVFAFKNKLHEQNSLKKMVFFNQTDFLLFG